MKRVPQGAAGTAKRVFMTKRSAITALLLVFVVFVFASSYLVGQQSGSSNTASIRGTVIDAKTSQPLNGASVSLHGTQASGAWNSATTTADGRFIFSGLVAGSYRLAAAHNGYLDSSGGHAGWRGVARDDSAAVSIAAGQTIDDLVLRLTPTGVISGRIINEREEAMPGVFVQSMKSSYRSGHREFSDARASFTDDRGEFRIWGLAPGQYYVRATNPRGAERGPAAAEIYLPTFYPGVADPGQTQAISLPAGEELSGINFALNPSRAVHVKGRILTSNAAPAKGAEVTLSQLSGGGYSVGGEADAAGKFDLPAVPAGSYVMVAQWSENMESSKTLMGRTTVQVGDVGLDSVDLVIFPGATVAGHVRIEGDRKLIKVSASLKPLEYFDPEGNVGNTAVQPDGTFVFHDVPEGNYRVSLSPLPDGYYMRPGAGEDAAGVLVSHGHASPVELRMGPGAGRIMGVVYKDSNNQEAAPSALVTLVPEGRRRSESEYYREATSDASGKFVLGSVPPGNYLLFAWDHIEEDAYMDPDFIQQYEDAGKPVRIEEGSNLNLQLQLATSARDSTR
jgi:protocatechuate 3,4-dioxygenase beta subunit